MVVVEQRRKIGSISSSSDCRALEKFIEAGTWQKQLSVA
jgi:hypothetical protein